MRSKALFSVPVIASMTLATVIGLTNNPAFAGAADGSGGGVGSQSLKVAPAIAPVLPNILYDVIYANSTAGTETVVSIKNTNAVACQVQVEWLFGFGAGQAGVSGPFNIPPQTTAEFTTANAGESVPPFVLNVFRDTTGVLEGSARIRSNCAASARLGVNAVLVTGIGSASGPKYTSISVSRPTGRVGD
ncbi:MAG: hypothetical protein KME17_26965 [Cyanosarcina radialis HA8281-LM2]|jgi:hypothetical protein|nr:hypothetical protein [Cyanosarcina radialis HA8281-LM2]